MKREPDLNSFLEDVKNHEMFVKLDQGIYRHLVFHQQKHQFLHRFEIVTTPSRLMITGDMGTWVFSRLPDMFEFFREPGYTTNVDYWAEKLQNGSSGGRRGCKEYDGDAYKERILEEVDHYDLGPEDKAKVLEEIEQLDFYDKYSIFSSINEFEVDLEDEEDEYVPTRELIKQSYLDRRRRRTFRFSDIWEIETEVYSYHFIWCCYAIAWAIQQYDKSKESNDNGN